MVLFLVVYANSLGKSAKELFGEFKWEVATEDKFPQQRNKHDCGVHMLLGIDYICKGKNVKNVDPGKTDYYRKKM